MDDMEEQLSLQADLSQIAQVPSWLERLSARYEIPEKLQFASNVCLEEVLVNIVRHGHGGAAGGRILVRFTSPRPGCFVFIVEDEAPRFNPLDQPELPALHPNEEMRIGGHGIRLLREFTSSLEYEPLPRGNRLKLFFSSEAFDRKPDQC